ncbi:antitoxin [Kineosporia sp. A_224]|uniref:antitoxin n=1 Tax=Kineosporia sp. A_224 TaxID=1962180 RepID=UPI000B4A812F|nr:antitoxin [Kineosporia sp. A_224]
MSMFDELKNKATDFIKDNPDKIEGVSDNILEKAADLADEKTGGKFSSQIDGFAQKADDAIGN